MDPVPGMADPACVVGRMAPTPSAGLHVGNIFSCLVAWLAAKSLGGRILLRIEDLDASRSRREYADAIMRDLELLGLTWDNAEVMWQHDRTGAYDAAFDRLDAAHRVYPCFCSRADLHAASAPHVGERYVYARTCRGLTPMQVAEKARTRPPAYRLKVPSQTWAIQDGIQGDFSMDLAMQCGDYILRRSDGVYSYQLAVVVDDLAQGVTQVVRGCDLLESGPQQDHLRGLLDAGAPRVTYAHVPLLLDAQGRRLSKRDHDQTLDGLLQRFGAPQRLLGHLAYITGLLPYDEPVTPDELLHGFSLEPLKGRKAITWR